MYLDSLCIWICLLTYINLLCFAVFVCRAGPSYNNAGTSLLTGPVSTFQLKPCLKYCQIINYNFGKLPVVLKTHLGVLGCSTKWVQLQGRPVLGHAGNFFDDELQQHKSLLEKWAISISGCLRNRCSPKVHGHAGLNDSFSPHI